MQIYKVLVEFAEDQRLNDLAKELEAKSAVFDKLREAMRIALPDGKDGINDNGGCSDMKTIKERVTALLKFSELVKLLEKNGFKLLKEKGSIRYYGKYGYQKLVRIDYHG